MLIEILLRRKIIRKLSQLYYTFFAKLKCKSYGERITANGRTWLTKNTTLSSNVNFNGFEIKGNGKVSIGSNFHSGTGCKIITDTHNYDNGNAIPYDSSYIIRSVVIKDNVWLGDDVTILGGVSIGEGAIIQAGSVVVKDIDDYVIAGGHPCRAFKTRDIEQYKNLKNNRQFH